MDKEKVKAFAIAGSIFIGIFFAGFLGINILMKIIVGHEDEVDVPSLIGMTFDEAREACTDLNIYLKLGGYEYSSDIAKGAIISQSPSTGLKIKIKRTINVVISLGSKLVKVPYVSGLSIEEANNRIISSGLHVGEKVYRYSEDIPKDKVIYTQPSAGTTVQGGSAVKIYISQGQTEVDSTLQKDEGTDQPDDNIDGEMSDDQSIE